MIDQEFEVVIIKTSVLRVRAVSKREAIMVAQQTLDGQRGYSEYAQDGWEIEYEIEPERTTK